MIALFRTATALLLATAALTTNVSATNQTGDEVSLSGPYLASRSASRERDVDQAAAYLNEALQFDSKNPVLIERLFQAELSSGDMVAAEDLAAKVVSFNSQHRMARVMLGIKDMKAKRFTEARAHFAEAAYTPIGELTAAILSAWSFAGEGNLNAAVKELAKLDGNESFANFKAFHESLIADHLKSGVRADQAYKRAYEQAGTSLRVVQAYGNYLQRQGKTAEAEKIYKSFLEVSDGNVIVGNALAAVASKPEPFVKSPAAGAGEAMFSLAAAMNDEESVEVALPYAQLAVALSDDKPVMLTLLGDIYTDMQRYESAIEAYRKTPETSELQASSQIEIAQNLQRLDRKTEAVGTLQKLLTRDAKNLDGWTALGNIHRNNENYKDAAAAYDSAIALLPEKSSNWQLYYYRGIARERLKTWDTAEADFRKALSISPDEASVLNYLGYSLIDRRQKLDEAIKFVTRAVELRPNDGYIVDSLGWAYYQLGDFEEAMKHMERAVDLKPGDPIIAEHLGDVYWRVGRKLEASFQWQHAKDNDPEPEDLARIEKKLKEGLTDPAPVKVTKKSTNG